MKKKELFRKVKNPRQVLGIAATVFTLFVIKTFVSSSSSMVVDLRKGSQPQSDPPDDKSISTSAAPDQ